MPRRKAAYRARQTHRIPEGVKAAAVADQLAGASLSETARAFGLDPSTVSRLATTLQGLDPDLVQRVTRGLPQLYAVNAAKFGIAAGTALDQGDLANATKAAFGSKLSVEAGRLAQPQAEQPGVMMLAFVQQTLNPPPVVIPAEGMPDDAPVLGVPPGHDRDVSHRLPASDRRLAAGRVAPGAGGCGDDPTQRGVVSSELGPHSLA